MLHLSFRFYTIWGIIQKTSIKRHWIHVEGESREGGLREVFVEFCGSVAACRLD